MGDLRHLLKIPPSRPWVGLSNARMLRTRTSTRRRRRPHPARRVYRLRLDAGPGSSERVSRSESTQYFRGIGGGARKGWRKEERIF